MRPDGDELFEMEELVVAHSVDHFRAEHHSRLETRGRPLCQDWLFVDAKADAVSHVWSPVGQTLLGEVLIDSLEEVRGHGAGRHPVDVSGQDVPHLFVQRSL